MADTLEIRLGGKVSGRSITTRDLDYADVHPLIDHIESAIYIEAGIDTISHTGPQVAGKLFPLSPVRLALAEAFSHDGVGALGAVYRFAIGPEAIEAVSKITAGLAGSVQTPLAPEAARQ